METQEKMYSDNDVLNLPWEVLAPKAKKGNALGRGKRKLLYLIDGGFCRNMERTQTEIEDIILGTSLVKNREGATMLFNHLKYYPYRDNFSRQYKQLVHFGFELKNRKGVDGNRVYWTIEEIDPYRPKVYK